MKGNLSQTTEAVNETIIKNLSLLGVVIIIRTTVGAHECMSVKKFGVLMISHHPGRQKMSVCDIFRANLSMDIYKCKCVQS